MVSAIIGGTAAVVTGGALYVHGSKSAPAYPALGVGGWPALIGIAAVVGVVVGGSVYVVTRK